MVLKNVKITEGCWKDVAIYKVNHNLKTMGDSIEEIVRIAKQKGGMR
jgi:hypothetical protein